MKPSVVGHIQLQRSAGRGSCEFQASWGYKVRFSPDSISKNKASMKEYPSRTYKKSKCIVGWRAASVVRSTGSSSRGAEFDFYHSHDGSLSANTIPRKPNVLF